MATCLAASGEGSCQATQLGKYSDVLKDTRERGIEFGGACGEGDLDEIAATKTMS